MIKPFIFLGDAKHIRAIDVQEIILLKAQRSYCNVILHNGDSFMCSKPLGIIAKELPENLFIRIGQSNIVNRNHIRQIDKCQKILCLTGDHKINYPMRTCELLALLGIVVSEAETACRETQKGDWED